jgi:hypothetical protein
MPKFALVPAFLAGAIIADAYRCHRAKKAILCMADEINDVVLETVIDPLHQENALLAATVDYLASKIADSDMELDEFDLIIINDLAQMKQ